MDLGDVKPNARQPWTVATIERRIRYRRLVEAVRIPDPAGGNATHYSVGDYQVTDGSLLYMTASEFHRQYIPYLHIERM